MKNLVNKLKHRETKLSVVGLGYVGLPIAIAFSKYVEVIGFDISPSKIEQYRSGQDPTDEVGSQAIQTAVIQFTSDPKALKEASFHIVAVPTPINHDKTPDLLPLKKATQLVAENLSKGSIVVFESTVYPGLTEELCIPILEGVSGLTYGQDFKVGYSPERINPGDKVHRLADIKKLVSGSDEEALAIIAQVYEWIIKAGVYKTASIKVAEAAKIIENAQRDINIAFMNELSIIFHKMGVDTKEVLDAAKTKWNFLDFQPGLVGGHCIGVDPYYLTHRAQQFGYQPEVILAGRRINDNSGKRIAQEIVKSLSKKDKNLSASKVGIFGFTFKSDCPDTRNTKVMDIVNELSDYAITPLIYDPEADAADVACNYGLTLSEETDMQALDALVIAVDHEGFKNKDHNYWINRLTESKIIFDIKGILNKSLLEQSGISYWRL
ncbi:nucleotide sugar dehydrogenase [Enterococcus sp. AZ109]|uniref:nucleotide sugar dehydrogenase n=1 Tax=Enterococcus sp. AZ109 TaxID=2774634 RepID=UPI003F224826